jgi:hypothetical protein
VRKDGCLALTTKTFRFVIEGEEMRNVYTFAGLTFALALAFSLTTAAQTSSTESKQKASPDQSQTGSAEDRHRDRVGERLEWLSQHLNLTEDQKKQLKPILTGELKQMRAVGEDARDCNPQDQSGNPRRDGGHNPFASQFFHESVQKVRLC